MVALQQMAYCHKVSHIDHGRLAQLSQYTLNKAIDQMFKRLMIAIKVPILNFVWTVCANYCCWYCLFE